MRTRDHRRLVVCGDDQEPALAITALALCVIAAQEWIRINGYEWYQHGVTASMSRRGNCYDNAVVESFWGKLKAEMVYHEHFTTKEEARAAVFEYIEMFYNRRRLHAALDYLSPEAFEARRVG